MLKAIFIDSEKKEVTEVEIERGLEPIYALLKCNCITSAESHVFNPLGHTLFVDDEGLLVSEPIGAFQFGDGQILSGNGLILSVDNEGESQTHHIKLNRLKELIAFKDISELPEPSFKITTF